MIKFSCLKDCVQRPVQYFLDPACGGNYVHGYNVLHCHRRRDETVLGSDYAIS